MEDFAEHLAVLQSNMNRQFRSDYESLKSEAEYTHHAARLGVNVMKNRYKNILPCELIRISFVIYLNCFHLQMITLELFCS